MLGASCSLELSEMELSEHRSKTEETKEVVTSGSSKDASSSGVLMKSVRMQSRQCSEFETAWSKKSNTHTLNHVASVNTLPMNPVKCMIEQ